MRKFSAAVTMVLALAFAATAALAAPESVVLEFTGEPGQEQKRLTVVDFKMDLEVRNPQTSEPVFTLNPQFAGSFVGITTVSDVAANGDLTLQSTIESFELELEVADFQLAMSLQGPDGGPPELFKLPALPIEAVISKQGKFVSLKGLDKLPIPGGKIGGEGPDPKQMIESIQRVTEKFAQPRFPDGPVAVGESWGWEIIVDPGEMAAMMSGEELPAEAKAMLSAAKIPVKQTSTLTGFEMVGGVECARIVTEAPWELEMPIGPGFMLREGGVTEMVTWFDHQVGQVVKEEVGVVVEMRAGTPELALAEMVMKIAVDSELQ